MRRPLDLSLYLVADVASCAERGVAATVAAAVAGGASAVQLRAPQATGRQFHELASALVDQLAGTPVTFFVDDRLDVALAAGADGVHLGQRDLPAAAARAVAGRSLLIGWSVTDLEEAEAAGRMAEGTVDYLGVGPVFPTRTKADAAPAIGLGGLEHICRSSRLPCVAIGGVDETSAEAVVEAGAVGVAVVSAICAARDPYAAALRLRGRVDESLARRRRAGEGGEC